MTMRRFAMWTSALLLAACASVNGPTVKVAFDPATDFSHVRSYSWVGKPDGGTPLMQQRISDGIDARLQARGWKLASNGDVRVDAHVSSADKENLNARAAQVGYIGWGGFGPPAPNSAPVQDTIEVGTLVVDMYDSTTRREMWRGSASGTLHDDPARMDALLQAALDKMFAGFPPGVMKK
jgi:hypothetical protein